MPTKTDEKEIQGVEELSTLPVNDPQAGYLPPQPHRGFNDGDPVPAEEQEYTDRLIDDWQEQAQAVKESEEKGLKEREERQAKDAEALRKWQEEQGQIAPVFVAPSDQEARKAAAASKPSGS